MLQAMAFGMGKHMGCDVSWTFIWRPDGAFYEEVGISGAQCHAADASGQRGSNLLNNILHRQGPAHSSIGSGCFLVPSTDGYKQSQQGVGAFIMVSLRQLLPVSVCSVSVLLDQVQLLLCLFHTYAGLQIRSRHLTYKWGFDGGADSPCWEVRVSWIDHS